MIICDSTDSRSYGTPAQAVHALFAAFCAPHRCVAHSTHTRFVCFACVVWEDLVFLANNQNWVRISFVTYQMRGR